MIQRPSDLLLGEVTWTIAHTRRDDKGTLRGASGVVRFRPTAVAISCVGVTVLPAAETAAVRDGVMDPIELEVNDPGLWVWMVEPEVGVTWEAFAIDVPAGGVDLATAAVSPGVGPIRATRGPRGASIVGVQDQGNGMVRYILEDGTLTGPVPYTKGLPGKSAYQAAKEAGYTGTEAEFGQAVKPGTLAWTAVTGKPATFPPAQHSHALSDITGLEQRLATPDGRATVWGAPIGVQLTTPTHEGSGQVTHPSVLYFPGKKFGWSYWMAITPYPDAQDAHEDPCVLVSNDGIAWQAAPSAPFPLDDQPGSPTSYNSDPHIVELPDGQLMVTWRTVEASNGNRNVFYERHSADGKTWTAKQIIWSTTGQFLSQSLVRVGGTWRMYGVELSGSTTRLAVCEQTTSGVPTSGGWTNYRPLTVNGLRAGRRLWHADIQYVGGRWWGLLNDDTPGAPNADGDLLLAYSADGLTWTVTPSPLVPRIGHSYDQVYKSSMVVMDAQTLDVFYTGFMRGQKSWRLYRTTATAARNI